MTKRTCKRTWQKTAVSGVCVLMIAALLFLTLCPSADAVGLVDDAVDTAHEYSRYPLENYQLDFYVDNSWDWLPWNWIDGVGKQVMYGLYCVTDFVWTINLYLSNASGYLVQQAYGLDFISNAADEIGQNMQTIAGISPGGLSADGFYAGFLLLIILIAGAYVAYTGIIKRETTKAVRAVLHTVLIFLLSGALIAYAPDIVSRLNEFSEDVSTASLSIGTKIVMPDAPGGGNSVELIRDSLFSVQVCQPWLLLQFGDTDTGAVGEGRIESLLSTSPSENNGEDRENAVKSEIEDNGNTNLTVTKAVNRLGTVFFLFLFNIGISVFVFLLTGMMIFSQVLFIIYVMFLPVSFVISMIPTFESSGRRAVVKLFNTILARAGITLVITIAFSISTMLYRISDGYPFFLIAFLQVVVFAGIYFKLGDLLGMFSLHDDGARSMGRQIMQRPRMLLHHQLHRLNRAMRTAAAKRPNDGGSAKSRSGADSGKQRNSRASTQPGIRALPVSASETQPSEPTYRTDHIDAAVSSRAERQSADAPAIHAAGVVRKAPAQPNTDTQQSTAGSLPALGKEHRKPAAGHTRSMIVPAQRNSMQTERRSERQASQLATHARPALPSPKPVQQTRQIAEEAPVLPRQTERPSVARRQESQASAVAPSSHVERRSVDAERQSAVRPTAPNKPSVEDKPPVPVWNKPAATRPVVKQAPSGVPNGAKAKAAAPVRDQNKAAPNKGDRK